VFRGRAWLGSFHQERISQGTTGRDSFCADRRTLARYFATTAFVTEPPALLFAVMFCGFTGQFNWPLKPPAPLFASVPMI